MEKTLLKNTLRELFSDFYETPIPELTRRQIDIPEAPRFATVILGMRRTGKTFLLYQRMNDLLSSGIPKDRILHVNFEDDRLMGITAEDLRYVPEVYYQMYPDNHGKRCYFFFDEIQEAPQGIASLKYFCENARELHVAAAGSLLGVVHHPGESYPVGKVDILRLYPMTFEEFLRQYYYVGGMPEVVLNWVEKEDVLAVRRNQNRIIAAYANDISKHAGQEAERIRMVWQSIPAQLAKENKKFVYGAVKKGGRAKEFELAIQWLIDAGLAYKVYNSKKPAVPLKFYEDFDAFKLFALDVGLLGAMANAPASLMLTSNDVFKEFKGAFSENYVQEQLITIDNLSIDYFSKENSKLEIDFKLHHPSSFIYVRFLDNTASTPDFCLIYIEFDGSFSKIFQIFSNCF